MGLDNRSKIRPGLRDPTDRAPSELSVVQPTSLTEPRTTSALSLASKLKISDKLLTTSHRLSPFKPSHMNVNIYTTITSLNSSIFFFFAFYSITIHVEP